MSNIDRRDLTAENQRMLRKLILTVQANSQSLELLLAICDDRNLQAFMIENYEAELQEKGIKTFQARLNPKQPSMRASLTELVERESTLQGGEPAVVTVLNADALLGVTLGKEKSEQERFFFSLQWTREALRRFEFAIVLWVPDAVATKLGQRAPDFWSWRGGVFEFAAQSKINSSEPLLKNSFEVMLAESKRLPIQSLQDLQKQVQKMEEASKESSLLITLYNSLGEAYESNNEFNDALLQYEKALDLAKKKNSLMGQAKALKNIGDSLQYIGRSLDSISYYEQSLEVYSNVDSRVDAASSLRGLGLAHYLLRNYQRCIYLQKQSLKISREINDRFGEANSLRNIGVAYEELGNFDKADEYRQQWLEVAPGIHWKTGKDQAKDSAIAIRRQEAEESFPYSVNEGVRNREALTQYILLATERLKRAGSLSIRENIIYKGFTLRRAVKISDFELGIGMRGDALFIFSEFSSLTEEKIRRFSALALSWAKDEVSSESIGQAFYNFRIPTNICFSVAIVDSLEESTRNMIRTTNPIAQRVDILWYEVPIVYELDRQELQYYFRASSFLENFRGEVAWKVIRERICELLDPSQ